MKFTYLIIALFFAANATGKEKEMPNWLLNVCSNSQLISTEGHFDFFIQKNLDDLYLVWTSELGVSELKAQGTFFLHAYPSTLNHPDLDPGQKFINHDFEPEIETYRKNGGSIQVVWKRIPGNDITSLVMGQYVPSNGELIRTWTYIFDVPAPVASNQKVASLEVTLNRDAYYKIVDKRSEAIEAQVLMTSKKDLVPALITFQGKTHEAELRLKGDWLDHLLHPEKWSFRVHINDDQDGVMGMYKFSIHNPEARNFAHEWVQQELQRREGLLALKYGFLNVRLRVEDESGVLINKELGIYAIEQGFDSYLIEANESCAGLLMKFDEDLIWKERSESAQFGDWDQFVDTNLQVVGPICVFDQKKVASNPILWSQFHMGRTLLEGYFDGEYSVEQVFDVESLAKYVAICNLMGSAHGMILHNLRFYYNPLSSKLEPVGFDNDAGREKLTRILNYHGAVTDSTYGAALVYHLERLSSDKYRREFFDNVEDSLSIILKALRSEYPASVFSKAVMDFNADVMRKEVRPVRTMFLHLDHTDGEMAFLDVKSLSKYPIRIEGLQHKSVSLMRDGQQVIVGPGYNGIIGVKLTETGQSFFNRNQCDNGNIKVVYRLGDSTKSRKEEVIGYPRKGRGAQRAIAVLNTSTVEQFEFITRNDSMLTIPKGNYVIQENLVIPAGRLVKLEAGVSIELKANANIISYSALQILGNEKYPVKIFSKEAAGGLVVLNSNDTSHISYAVFDGLGHPQINPWSVSGAVNFYESPVIVDHSIFKENECEDALKIVHTSFEVTSSEFVGCSSDAFKGNFVVGKIGETSIKKIGNDGINVTGSELELVQVSIEEPLNKGISAGERSVIRGQNIQVKGGEIAFEAKDLSRIELKGGMIEKSKLGYVVFQKKLGYGPATMNAEGVAVREVQVVHLVESGSELSLDGVLMDTTGNVIDRLFGKKCE